MPNDGSPPDATQQFTLTVNQAPAITSADSTTFTALIEAKRNRRDAFYTTPAGKVDLCGIDVPTREAHITASTKP